VVSWSKEFVAEHLTSTERLVFGFSLRVFEPRASCNAATYLDSRTSEARDSGHRAQFGPRKATAIASVRQRGEWLLSASACAPRGTPR
jgi:hypothetical protein